MSRLIDADKLKSDYDITNWDKPYGCSFKVIDSQPTVDAEPVRRGKWIKSEISCEEFVCSECGGACWYYDVNKTVSKSKYCPNCGAKMQEELRMDRKYTIYAIDFDGTLCESVFPGIGEPNTALINHLIKRKKQGNKLILWTCRVGDRLEEAVEWCRGYGLEFDAVNENLPEMIEQWGGETRKIFADVYIDDKAVNKPKYCIPYKVGVKNE